jgi:hypothetical protein
VKELPTVTPTSWLGWLCKVVITLSKKKNMLLSLPAINRHVSMQHLSLLTRPRIHRIQKLRIVATRRMKGVPNCLVALAIMALACSVASAYDPSPLQDFCVALESTSTDAGTYVLI